MTNGVGNIPVLFGNEIKQAFFDAVDSFSALREALQSVIAGQAGSVNVDLQFDLPWIALALPLPFIVLLFVRFRGQRSQALLVPAQLGLGTSEQASRRTAGISAWWLLALLAWCCLVLAAARPHWIGPPVSSPVSGRDLMMSIDISGSMNESDLYSDNSAYTRIDVVREVASRFVEQRAGDRIGLIMFGSQAYVQTPLTFDHKTVAHFIREAHVGLAGRSTAIGDAIGLAVKRLRERPVDSRVLLLLTDGANSAGVVDPLEAARIAAENDIRIHTIGVGAEGGRSVFGFPMTVQRSELDEKTLIKISELTGGQYFRARDVKELQRVYQLIDELEPVESNDDNFRIRRELFAWPLSVALLLGLLISWFRYARFNGVGHG